MEASIAIRLKIIDDIADLEKTRVGIELFGFNALGSLGIWNTVSVSTKDEEFVLNIDQACFSPSVKVPITKYAFLSK
jgi:hypothetical protein